VLVLVLVLADSAFFFFFLLGGEARETTPCEPCPGAQVSKETYIEEKET